MDLHLTVAEKNPGIFSEPMLGLFGQALWVGLAVFALWWVGRSNLHSLVGRVQEVSVAGMTIKLSDDVEAIAENKGVALLKSQANAIAMRLENSRKLMSGAKLLWVDDKPDNNRLETRLLESFGVKVDRALTTDDGARLDLIFSYDLIISDMVRGNELNAGTDLVRLITARELPTPIIFYVGKLRPLPAHVFGITARPDELFHLILDVFGRRRS